MEVKLKTWSDRLQRRGIKVSRNSTVYLYMNKNEDDCSIKLQDVEPTKVMGFKYLESTVQRNANHGPEIKKKR